jgi:hypothetical protein
MAADKSVKSKRKGSGAGGEAFFLRQRSEPRSERRFPPRSTPTAVLTLLGGSLAAFAVGAGVFGQWLRGDDLGPHRTAPYLLAAGVALFAAVLLFGQWSARPIRVGDAGVAVEKGAGEMERIAWCDVTRLLFSDGVLTVQAAGTSISISVALYPQAAARALAEARVRIPSRAAALKEAALPAHDGVAGEFLPLDPPQVVGQRCKSSGKQIAFEGDARLCGRCGEVYHKDGAPRRCATCDVLLRD